MIPQLAHCEVFHGRTKPKSHTFRYNIAYLAFETRQSEQLRKILKRNFHGMLALKSQDYLDGAPSGFDEKIRGYLKSECAYDAESIQLITLPRSLGYGFNPISFWVCFKNEKLDAVLCEVNNTFGERHCYWLNPDQGFDKEIWVEAEKIFHVSPFFPVDGFYKFRFDMTTSDFFIEIRHHANDGTLRLVTYLKGLYQPLESVSATRFFARYGWISLAVIARIHLQALNLWRKKATFFKKPDPPATFVSGGRKETP